MIIQQKSLKLYWVQSVILHLIILNSLSVVVQIDLSIYVWWCLQCIRNLFWMSFTPDWKQIILPLNVLKIIWLINCFRCFWQRLVYNLRSRKNKNKIINLLGIQEKIKSFLFISSCLPKCINHLGWSKLISHSHFSKHLI